MNTENTNQQQATLTPELADSFTKVTKAVSDMTESAHKIALTGPVVAMLTYGPVMILIAIALKVFPFAQLGTAEFSLLVACGTLLYICA